MLAHFERATYAPRSELERLSIANPDKVEPVITGDLPDQAAYLVFLTLGLERYARSNWTEAIRYFEMILTAGAPSQVAPTNRSEAYHWRGAAHLRGNDLDRAIEDFALAIELKQDFVEAYIDRGAAHWAKGDDDRAIADLTQAITLKPDSAEAYFGRGFVHNETGDPDLRSRITPGSSSSSLIQHRPTSVAGSSA